MNILYYTTDKVHYTKGGTERTTITVALALKKLYGCKCYSIYERAASTSKENCFEREFLWDQARYDRKGNIKFLKDIIIENQINVIIVQGAFIHVKNFHKAVHGLNCRIIFAHHFQPGWEYTFFNIRDVIKQIEPDLKAAVRWMRNIIFYPIYRNKYKNLLSALYKEAYDYADNVILLSKEFIIKYNEIGRFADNKKFVVIPNGLSFSEFATEKDISNKKHIVLIVSRLDEGPKRISIALRIWKRVKQNPEAASWKLNIIGEGPAKQMYLKIIKKEKIPDVYFLGRQDPLKYYKEASLFMMTSRSESWGLTLTESQQMGVVALAFDTYESLKDIITNNINGCVIPAGDDVAYVQEMLDLMVDDNRRQRLALSGLISCRQFMSEKIAQRWWNIIN